MEYSISKKAAFTVVGFSKRFKYGSATAEIPLFWKQYFVEGRADAVCGRYGICIDDNPGTGDFEYLIADNYDPCKELPEGFTFKTLPQQTWAIFPCVGPNPMALQRLTSEVFSKWLPGNEKYLPAGECSVEYYSDPADYRFGTADEQYYCELWVPVREK